MSEIRQLSPRDVRERCRTETDTGGQLLDVRERWEYDIAHLPNARHIPMAELPSRYRELNPDAPLVIYCHHGIRSWHAACFLKECGFQQVFNLEGGIDAWSRQIEPGLARY